MKRRKRRARRARRRNAFRVIVVAGVERKGKCKAGKYGIIRGDNPIADRKRHIQDHV